MSLCTIRRSSRHSTKVSVHESTNKLRFFSNPEVPAPEISIITSPLLLYTDNNISFLATNGFDIKRLIALTLIGISGNNITRSITEIDGTRINILPDNLCYPFRLFVEHVSGITYIRIRPENIDIVDNINLAYISTGWVQDETVGSSRKFRKRIIWEIHTFCRPIPYVHVQLDVLTADKLIAFLILSSTI